MSIKLNLGGLLAGGVLGGIAGYAEDQDAKIKAQKAADNAAALEKQKTDSAMAIERAKQAMARPEVSSYDATDDQGNTVKRTIKQTFDMNANGGQGGWNETTLGQGAIDAKAPVTRNVINGTTESTQQWDPKAKTWNDIGAPGPRFNPVDPMGAAMSAWMQKNDIEQQQREAARQAGQDATNTRMATAEGRKDFDAFQNKLLDPITGQPAKNAGALKAQAMQKYGVPTDAPNADDLLKQAMVNNYTTTLGVKPVAAVQPQYDPDQVAITPAPAAQPESAANAPGSLANPIKYKPGMPKPPSGTHVMKPDGSVVVVP